MAPVEFVEPPGGPASQEPTTPTPTAPTADHSEAGMRPLRSPFDPAAG